ncbi:MAG TPA: RsmE family RNA methyltransferase [Terriglobales bacterium]|nr:RsmE family RNA methyltransferase [Terriglobales bacterium]
MTRRRWIADEISGDRAALTGAHADHLVRVLRAQIGQEFDIATGKDVRLGRIISISADRVEFALGECYEVVNPASITLILSIFKFDRMEWAIEKCTELGVAKIVPLIAQRTEKHLASAAVKRVERWQRIARQASEQSRRTAVPAIVGPKKLQDVLELSGARIILSEVEQQAMLKDVLPSSGDMVLAFGPEGGWTEAELKLFEDAGWASASLGKTILRVETAVIAATALAVL